MASREPVSGTRSLLNGDELIGEILRNLEEGLFRVRFTTLVPCLFHVYLHPEDLDELRPVLPYLREEAERALDERLAELNESGRPNPLLQKLGLDSRQPSEFKRLAPEWRVEFLANHEPGIQRGDIEISSELAPAPRPELGAGSMTRRITRRTTDGATSSVAASSVAAEPQPTDAVSTVKAPVLSAPLPSPPDNWVEQTTAGLSQSPVFARLRYTDKGGPHTYEMTRDLVVIGRGGRSYWVDLKLDTVPDVSREHCRLRRDPADGAFYLKDVSQFGTTINGEAVPRSVDGEEGSEVDRNIEVRLPARATLGLADRVFLEFEATAAP